jgi:leader peptidase (prepilin peptidase) / N-methyltransferase
MFLSWPILMTLGLGFFLIGTVVGSFLNVCIYRIPWQKSVVWPSSTCPRCLGAIGAQDNIPILSGIALCGGCCMCGTPISMRYPLVEALVGLLFLGAFLTDVIGGPRIAWGQVSAFQLVAAAYHATFLALLVAATFIDYDLMIIPDQITVTGMIVGVALGTIWPAVRSDLRPAPPSLAALTHFQGFWAGVLGLAVGAGLTQLVRKSAGAIFRREAMGFGDVTLMGMIGAFMGWQGAVLTFFLGPFFGLGHASWRLVRFLKKWITGDQLSTADRELPYGPYLSMAAATLYFLWPWVWDGWARGLFDTIYVLFWWMLGIHLDLPA